MRQDEHPIAESLRLQIGEVDDKKLNRAYYYAEDEPKELVRNLIDIEKKHKQF